MAPRKKTKLEKFFSFNQHRRRFGAPSPVNETQGITSLKSTIIPGQKKVYTHGSSKNLKEHLKSLRDEFIGDPELCYVVAKKIVLIRRESKVSENFPIGHCERAPEIATKKVTIDISRIVKFIEAAYTAKSENKADWAVP